ncbi:hypothetical protein KCU92_g10021, partial [Aureobasidium melanogenum]
MLPKDLHTSRSSSKLLGDINHQRSTAYHSTAFGQAQERLIISANRSRSACGHLHQTSPQKVLSNIENVAHSDNFYDQETSSSTYGEIFGEDIENVFKDASPFITAGDNRYDGDDRESGNIWPLSTSEDRSQDQDTSLWSNNLWSASPKPPPIDTASLIPLPAPNYLTSTYLPFSSHLALTTHFTPSTLTNFQTLHTPIFLHSILQLPSTLAQLLCLRTSGLLCRLTPSILLKHTTILDSETLLPSLVPAKAFSTYHHVNGLLYFPCSPTAMQKINDFLTTTHTTRTEMRKVQTQIRDSEGKRCEIGAWAWVAVDQEGTEEWWTLEDFVAGRIVGLGTVEW